MARSSRVIFGSGLALAIVLAQPSVLATNGYFSHGFGTVSKAMAGAGAALSGDLMGPATNPATIVFATPGIDLGIGVFSPDRSYEVIGNPTGFPGTFGLAPGVVRSGSRVFPIPHAAFVRSLDGGKAAFGLAMFGNGGMNTSYQAATFGITPTGVDLSQMFIAPTYARRLGARQAIGVSALFAYQRFEAKGLAAFAPMSADADCLTNLKHDNAYGGGVRIGYLGRLTKKVSVGASYQSRVWMTRFDKYAGLFAGGGSFDIPSNWVVGVAVTPVPDLDLTADVQQLRYSEVPAVSNALLPNLMAAPLGTDGGAGFGWHDMTAVKLGAQLRRGQGWTWRGGYSFGHQPVPVSETLFNILAPGIIEQHATFGVTRELSPSRALNVAAMRAFTKNVTGGNPLEAPGAQRIKLTMNQLELEVGMTFRF